MYYQLCFKVIPITFINTLVCKTVFSEHCSNFNLFFFLSKALFGYRESFESSIKSLMDQLDIFYITHLITFTNAINIYFFFSLSSFQNFLT